MKYTVEMVKFAGFSDELLKIAEDQEENRRFNKEKFKQFLKNTAVIGAGTGIGYGLGRAASSVFDNSRALHEPAGQFIVNVGLPVLGGLTAGALLRYRNKLRDELLEEAYQRGKEKGQEDV